MRKVVSILLVVILVITCFALTGCDCKHEWNPKTGKCNKCGEECNHTFNQKGRCDICKCFCTHENHDQYTRVCKDCGNQTLHNFVDFKCTECGRETIFYDRNIPEKYDQPSDKKGTVVTFNYNTYAYAVEAAAGIEQGTIAVEKIANVYLPYGYDANKQYNVMYLMHGSDENHNTWFGIGELNGNDKKAVDNVPMIDNVFALGEAEPFIIVTPTFYSPAPEGSEYAKFNEIDGIGTYQLKNYPYEMVDLMKAFESQYKTYANCDVTTENLISTREHRAFAGLSMGSYISFASIVPSCLQYFAYIGSFSGAGVIGENDDDPQLSVDVIKKALTETYPSYDILYWYHGQGTDDFLYDSHRTVYNGLIKELSEKLRQGDNIDFVIKEGHEHAMDNWHIDLYNVMQIFFKK